MILTNEQIKKMKEAAKPLVKFICEECTPHTQIQVTPTGAELLSASATVTIEEFLKD